MKIKYKLFLLLSLVLTISLSLSGLYLTHENLDNASTEALDYVDVLAKLNAREIGIDFDKSLSVVVDLAVVLKSLDTEEVASGERRNLANNILKEILKTQSNLVGIWVCYTKNRF